MKAAVLGVGRMGSGVVHILKNKCDAVQEVIAYDVDAAQLARLGDKAKVRTTTDLGEILRDDAVRVVFVTAANHAHKALATAALEAGKAVMCEKPIATTLADARQMVETAERLNGWLQIGFELRYSTLYTTVKEWINAGLLGTVVNTQCTYICSEFHGKGSWRNNIATGGSMFGEKLSHYVDLPRWWVGDEVVEAYAVCAPNTVPYYEVHDNYHATYRFKNGAVSQLTFMMSPAATFKGDPLVNVVTQQQGDGHALQFLVVGTKGAAATDVFYRKIKRWEFGDSPDKMTSTWVEDITWDCKEDGRYFHNGVDQTIDIVRRVAAGEPPYTPARDSYETMRLCEAVERSADTGALVRLSEVE